MKISKKQFKELESEWYSKLKEAGFNDIEDTKREDRPLKEWHISRFRNSSNDVRNRFKAEYYIEASRFLEEFDFKNDKERVVWQLHSAGHSTREIEKSKNKAKGYSRPNVQKIIKKYTKIMFERRNQRKEEDEIEQFRSTYCKIKRTK